MTDYSNWKVLKTVINYTGDDEEKKAQAQTAQEQYSEVAAWCNEGGQYTIVETDQCYEVQPVEPYEPTIEEKQSQVRSVRDRYLQECDFTQLPDAPFTEQEKQLYAEYRQYLRDYTTRENWWLVNPLTFEQWVDLE